MLSIGIHQKEISARRHPLFKYANQFTACNVVLEPPDQRTEWMQCQRTSREQPFVTDRKRGARLIERETLNVP